MDYLMLHIPQERLDHQDHFERGRLPQPVASQLAWRLHLQKDHQLTDRDGPRRGSSWCL